MSGNEPNNSLYEIETIGSELLTGGKYGPEAGLIGLSGYFGMLALSLVYLRFATKSIKIN